MKICERKLIFILTQFLLNGGFVEHIWLFFLKKNMDQDLPSSSGEVYLKGYIGS